MYEGIHHVSLAVANINLARNFYEKVLGFTLSNERPAFDFAGAWYELGATQLHLIESSTARTLRGTVEIDSKDGHFAIRVTEIAPILSRLDAHQWEYRDNPYSITGWHQLFVTDPDGNVIEFNMPQSQ